MDHLTIAEDDIVERYLLGQLTAAEAVAFEAHYVDCPECLEKLELGQVLHRGLREIAAEEGSRGPALAAPPAPPAGGRPSRPRRPRPWQAALAAALLTAVVLPWALLAPALSRERGESARLAGELERSLAPQGGMAVVSLGPERAGPADGPSTRIVLGAAPEWVVLALEAPPAPLETRYRVRLSEPTGKQLWQSGPLAPDAGGRVTVGVHSTWLTRPEAVLALDELGPSGEPQPAARFAFRVERRGDR